MSKHSAKKELILLPILVIVISLCVVGHFLLQINMTDSHSIKYFLAALPFIMFGFVIIAFKIATKSESGDS